MKTINEYMNDIHQESLNDIIKRYPITEDFLENYRLSGVLRTVPFLDALTDVEDDLFEEFGLTRSDMIINLGTFLGNLLVKKDVKECVSSITIQGGVNKAGEPEAVSLTIKAGEVVSIVGPTGSGKSQLLNDIECLAQKDTPTKRQILINGNVVDETVRFEMDGKLVAQLSQNMNFVMDLSVEEFLEMHAKCRMTNNADMVVQQCFACANELAGEQFSKDTKVTQLSGGQSRALMIADTAYMSDSPIVLVDEIENAGINRRQAIELLAKRDKIILVSTHDPLLALSADKRIVIKNGGIYKIIETSDKEKSNLSRIEQFDNTMQQLRESLRLGACITEDLLKI